MGMSDRPRPHGGRRQREGPRLLRSWHLRLRLGPLQVLHRLSRQPMPAPNDPLIDVTITHVRDACARATHTHTHAHTHARAQAEELNHTPTTNGSSSTATDMHKANS